MQHLDCVMTLRLSPCKSFLANLSVPTTGSKRYQLYPSRIPVHVWRVWRPSRHVNAEGIMSMSDVLQSPVLYYSGNDDCRSPFSEHTNSSCFRCTGFCCRSVNRTILHMARSIELVNKLQHTSGLSVGCGCTYLFSSAGCSLIMHIHRMDRLVETPSPYAPPINNVTIFGILVQYLLPHTGFLKPMLDLCLEMWTYVYWCPL